ALRRSNLDNGKMNVTLNVSTVKMQSLRMCLGLTFEAHHGKTGVAVPTNPTARDSAWKESHPERPRPLGKGDRRFSMEKKTYHHGDLREALLRAGEEVLRDRGLQSFTLRECARRAGVSHAAPKHHFGDVRGLLTEIAAHGFRHLTRRLRTKLRAAGADLDAQFIATGEAYVSFAEANPEHFRIMFRSDLVDVRSQHLVEAAVETFTELTNVIHRQRGEPEIDADALDDSTASTSVVNDIVIGWSHVHGLAHLKVEGQLTMIPKAALKDAMAIAAVRLGRMLRADAARR
ncbi:MAG TPA: TetR/AcrR family transcriptional regulator, partial [Candidatus Cybelea sp.]|nr:TetR/AcrR family transcriptional regulator [Candidatus Cybelea sp.]